MDSLRIETTITGVTLELPQLQSWRGKRVEIVVTAIPAPGGAIVDGAWTSPLAGSVASYVDPFLPTTPTGDWEAAR